MSNQTPDKTTMHDLAIVIVNWNTREILRECLASLAGPRQHMNCDIIVVDNASSDGSSEMVREHFPWARLIQNDENRGFAAANNQAIETVNARHVLLLNSDTVVLGDALGASVRYLDEHKDIGGMGCRVLNTDRTMQPTCFRYPSLLNLFLLFLGVENMRRPAFFSRRKMLDWARDSERDVDVVTGCYLMVRKEVIDQVGVLDEAFYFYGEETDWCKRIIDAGWRLTFAPVGEIIHHGNSSAAKLNARRDVLLTEALVRVHHKHGGPLMAALAWLILSSFNVSRAIAWTCLGIANKAGRAAERGRHFRAVAASWRKYWPATAAS